VVVTEGVATVAVMEAARAVVVRAAAMEAARAEVAMGVEVRVVKGCMVLVL
jgi:hypothetical protein